MKLLKLKCTDTKMINMSSLWKKTWTINLQNFIKIDFNFHFPFMELSIISVRDIKVRTWSWSAKQYRVWSDCTNVHYASACLTLNWWQRLITFVFRRVKVRGRTTNLWEKKTIKNSNMELQNKTLAQVKLLCKVWHMWILQLKCILQ